MRRKTGTIALVVAAVVFLQTPATALAECVSISEEDTDDEGNPLMELTYDGDVEAEYGPYEYEDENGNTVSGNDWGSAAGAFGGVTLIVNGAASALQGGPAVDADGGASVTINGDAMAGPGPAVVAFGEGTSVTVTGDATSEGEIGVNAGDLAAVAVGGNVENTGEGGTGVLTWEAAQVTVAGDVTASGEGGIGVQAWGSSSVAVDGSVEGTDIGMLTDGSATVVVKKDVTGVNSGINLFLADTTVDSGAGRIIVLGTVSATDEMGNMIWVELAPAEAPEGAEGPEADEVFADPTMDKILAALPDIIVGALEEGKEDFWMWNSYDQALVDAEDENAGALNDAIFLEKIKYYIEQQGLTNGSVAITGGTTVDGYLVAGENDELVLTVSPDEGYELDSLSGGRATAVRNADGTWSVTVPRGGGISISAVFKAISSAETDNQSTTTDNQSATPAENTAAAGAGQSTAAASGDVFEAVSVNWENVQTQINDTTEGNINVVTGGVVDVAAATMDKLAEKGAVLALHVGNGIAVSLSGQELRTTGQNLKITFTDKTGIPENVEKEVLNGALSSKVFAMKEKTAYGAGLNIHFNMGEKYAGKYANLYHYDEQTGKMVCDGSFRITENGQAMFALLRGDEYIVTVTEQMPAEIGTVYIVSSGDTLSAIAARRGVSLKAMLAANAGIQANRIYPGQRLSVPR